MEETIRRGNEYTYVRLRSDIAEHMVYLRAFYDDFLLASFGDVPGKRTQHISRWTLDSTNEHGFDLLSKF